MYVLQIQHSIHRWWVDIEQGESETELKRKHNYGLLKDVIGIRVVKLTDTNQISGGTH